MNLSQITFVKKGIFSLATFHAIVLMETDASISIGIGHLTNAPREVPPGTEEFLASSDPQAFFDTVGWIDVHYPCKRQPAVFIRLNIPAEYHVPERLDTLIRELYRALSIPEREKYGAYYSSVADEYCILPDDEF